MEKVLPGVLWQDKEELVLNLLPFSNPKGL